MDKHKQDCIKFGTDTKDAVIDAFHDVHAYITTDLVKREPIVPALIFGIPLVLSMLLHIIEQGDLFILKLDVIFFGLLGGLLCIAGRNSELGFKIICSICTFSFGRLMAEISAIKLLLLSIIPWITQVILEEIQHDMTKNEKKKDDKKQLAEPKKEEPKKEEPKKEEPKKEEPKKEEPKEEEPKKEEPKKEEPKLQQVEPEQQKVEPEPKKVAPKPTKKYIEERKQVTIDLRKALDLKGDRAYQYLITRFKKHALGRFFQGDYTRTDDDKLPLIVSNMEQLLAHEQTHQIWTHMYSTQFAFIFPEDIMPKVRDINWEIDTFLLYAALCRILSLPDETKIIFKYYNTLHTTTQDNVVINDSHEGTKIVILPDGNQQPYLVKYTLKIAYTFNQVENQYVDHISCKGLVDFKLTPYVALKNVNMCLETAPSAPIVTGPNRSSLRMSSNVETRPRRESSLSRSQTENSNTSTNTTPTSTNNNNNNNNKDRENEITTAFIDSSLKK